MTATAYVIKNDEDLTACKVIDLKDGRIHVKTWDGEDYHFFFRDRKWTEMQVNPHGHFEVAPSDRTIFAFPTDLTEQEYDLFWAYANDAGNWSGSPMVGGNVNHKKAHDGLLSSLKTKGYIYTEKDTDNPRITWMHFTSKGEKLCEEIGFPLR